ncbi:putative ABC transport system permease protein [Pustulibacterium marinum]|uniref:Putative ABC transport system permease protein n=1 Tax=Pustulibacterium marinum TaxID=1224947 RepID=A0A1I7FLX4_9FLAO|nr:ABC transporter permease [Pustulibacterium marinum]SFU37155.1 putative ABC transport system permease protein [Pustulibacterium marinum]
MKFTQVSENIKIAFDAIKSQALRTILTVMIISLGITALVGILSIVSALENTLSSDFASMGANTFNLSRYDTDFRAQGSGETQKINPIISYAQASDFKEKFTTPFAQTSVSFYGTSTAEVKYESEKTDPEVSVIGADENFISNSGLEIEDGRDFYPTDISNNVNVCVLGSSFRDKLFKDINPIGKIISIRGNKFKVIGILKEKGSTFGNNQDNRVIIPLQLARSIYTLANVNYSVSVRISKKEFLNSSIDNAIITFRNIRGLSPIEDSNFGIRRSDDLINRIGNITGGLTFAGAIIGFITIFGSSIALLNIMLVSVTERTREIGIRKALGAKKISIVLQFFVETALVAQLGALVGITFGVIIGFYVSKIAGFDFIIPWSAAVWAIVISAIVAIISGVYPAIKAAKLDPVEALRYE